MKLAAGVGLLMLAAAGCTPTPHTETAGPAQAPDAAPAPFAAIKTAPALCEFRIGESLPVGSTATLVKEVPTEGDPRVFHEHAACDGALPVFVELEGDKIDQLRVEQAGACVPGIACVGDAFSAVATRFPDARTSASMIEGAWLALMVDDRTAVGFETDGVGDECFDTRDDCTEQFRNQRVIAIVLS